MCDIASEDVDLSTDTEDELLQLSEYSILKLSFKGKELLDFWICAISEYPILAKRAVKFLLPLTTTYLCESGFSYVTVIKTKQRNCMLTLQPYLPVSPKSSDAFTCLFLRDKFKFRTKCFLSIFIMHLTRLLQ